MQEITTGSYKADTYDHFYKLSVEQDSNVFLKAAHNTGYSAVYSPDMEFITKLHSGNEPMALTAGEYIVHASYSSPRYAVLDVYIPSESSYQGLTSLTSGSYQPVSYNNFYSLEIHQGGNLFLNMSAGSGGGSAVYDKNLNFIKEANYSGTTYLDAGEYVVMAYSYGSPSRAKLNTYIPEELLIPSDSNVDVSISAEQIEKLTELYTGFFGRAAEYNGLEYHKKTLEELLSAGLTEDQAFVNIANQFWIAGKQYSQNTGFSDYMSDFDFISTVYANVLGRPDAKETDLDGINYWINNMKQSGSSHGEMVLKVLEGAHNYIEENPTDKVSNYVESLLSNRTDISLFFAQESISGDLFGEQAIQTGRDVMQRIDQNVRSVENVKNALVTNTLLDLPEIELVGVGSIDTLAESIDM